MFSFFHFYLWVRYQLKSIENANPKSTTSHFLTPRIDGEHTNIMNNVIKVFFEGFIYIYNWISLNGHCSQMARIYQLILVSLELRARKDLSLRKTSKIWTRCHHLLLKPPMFYNVRWWIVCFQNIILNVSIVDTSLLVWLTIFTIFGVIYESC